MEDTIFILGEDGKLIEMNESFYDSEDLLQRLLNDYPKLLAGSQVNPEDPRRWLLISRELGIPDDENAGNRWAVDHLFVDQKELKMQLREKLNAITGVNIPAEKINKRPSFNIGLLAKESELQKFIDAFDWFYQHYGK